jgi:hypothetical protein
VRRLRDPVSRSSCACGSNFEAYKTSWNGDGVYVCSSHRRKPGLCTNTLTLPIPETDRVLLDIIEGEVLGTRYINELLSLVDREVEDETPRLEAERDRLSREVVNLVESIAAGVSAGTVAPQITIRESRIADINAQLRFPRPERLDVERLRAALEQRTTEWREVLRGETHVARLLLRRLVEPIVLHTPAPDDIPEGPLEPEVTPEATAIAWETGKKLGLLEGFVPVHLMASPTGLETLWTFEKRRVVDAA